MDSDSSDIDFIITIRRHKLIQFCKIYWRSITFITVPLLLLPIAFVGSNNAYKCFYVFILTMIFWILDVLHPTITSLIPVALATIMDAAYVNTLHEIYLRNILLDSLGVMIIIIAIEHSNIHRRVAIKFLQTFGCSHYRLSFFLFFITMFLSMWISSTIACGLMMPFVKSTLTELERMGLLEIYETIDKEQQTTNLHEQSTPRPTDFTVFYFLGITYSASIGSIATITGSPTNQIFKIYTEIMFPSGSKIEFPHFLLLNLPGVLLMETSVYLWLNIFFLGMFRIQSDLALQTGLSEEETLYIKTLLASNYRNLDAINFHEITVGLVIILTIFLQIAISSTYLDDQSHLKISSPCIISAIILFVMPINLHFTRYFKKRTGNAEFLPRTPTKSCLNWKIVQNHIHWSVLFITVSSSTIFEALKYSGMTLEFEKFLSMFANWSEPVIVIIVITLCKILTECANDVCVAYCILPHIARLSVLCKIHPHYLMMAATLSGSLSFHLLSGSPSNAMVASYVHIPIWKMMYAGIVPTLIACVINWFTMAVWSKVVWTDINIYPKWAENHVFNI